MALGCRTQVTDLSQFLARRTAMALRHAGVFTRMEVVSRERLAVVASVSAALVICLGALL